MVDLHLSIALLCTKFDDNKKYQDTRSKKYKPQMFIKIILYSLDC